MYSKKYTRKDSKPKPTPTKPPVMDERTGNPSNPKDWTNSASSKMWGKQFALATNKAKQAAISKAREGSDKRKMQRGIDKVVGK